MLKTTWKRTLLTGGFALLLLSGSAVSAAGRPVDPILLQSWSPLAYQSHLLTKWKSDFQTESLHRHFYAVQLMTAPASSPVTAAAPFAVALAQSDTATVTPLMAAALQAAPAIEPLMAVKTAEPSQPAAAAPAPTPAPVSNAKTTEPAPKAAAAQPKKTAAPKAETKAAAVQPKAKAAEAQNLVTTVTGATITPKQTIQAVASAYTGSAEENGGYAGVDYFGNSLKVGSIAVDPKVIPLGSTVYVTGYTYDGLPVGGMMAKAVDIGGAIKGDRIDIYVPDSNADKFGFQNVTVYVVD